MPDENTITFDMPGDRPYSTIRGIPAYQDAAFYEQIMESYALAAVARDDAFPAGGQPAPAAAPPPGAVLQQSTATAPPQPAQGGRQHNPWPPVVVPTTNDDGTPAQGCSWHKTSEATGSRPRPFRYFDADANHPQAVWKCTGQTGKDPSGYCPLFVPAAAPEPVAQPQMPAGEPV